MLVRYIQLQEHSSHYIYSDIDECSTDTDNCDMRASCINNDGSFLCTCNIGYTGDGIMCTGI